MNRFCVINAEDSKIWEPISFAQMFETGLRKEGDQWDVCELASGAQLPSDILDYCGVVITGSHYNCRDRDSLPWFEPLCEFIRKAAEVGSPKVYGGCFGCQIIAHALGGEVDYNPEKQFALKAENISILPSYSKYLQGRGTCCDDDKCACLNIVVSHGECVVRLPPEAEQIGTSNSCVNEMYVAGPKKNIIGSQSHPEILDVKYSIYERIAPVVIDQRQRLVGDQVTESMDSFAKFTGDDSRLLLSNISEFLHNNEILKAKLSETQSAKSVVNGDTDNAKSSSMATAATKLTSLAETAKAASKASTRSGLSRSASSATSTPANAAARQAQMNETATRLALLASNIRGATPLTSPNGSKFTSPSGSVRVSPSVGQRKTASTTTARSPRLNVPAENSPAKTTGEASPSTPSSTGRVSRVIRSAGRSRDTVKAPTASASESSNEAKLHLPSEVSPKSIESAAATTTTTSSSSVNKDIMAEVVVNPGSGSATTSPATSPTRVFAPIVVEKVSVSPEDVKIKDVTATSAAVPEPAAAQPKTPAEAPQTTKREPASIDAAAGNNSNSMVSYGALSIFSLLFLGGLSFFMYRKWRR